MILQNNFSVKQDYLQMIALFLYAAARLTDIAGIINHDLIMLSNWAKQWLDKFNQLKTEAVLFTLPQLIFDNTIVSFVDDHKHLDITFSSNGQ